MNPQQEIADMLHNAMGFDAAALSESAACRAVKKRMAQCGQPDESSYLIYLKASPLELSQLIEELVVPETWFFRDGKPFETLQCYVMEEWLAANPERPLRLLSVPCSSGEEPYSAVMALLDAGLLPERIYVEGIDISNVALAKAQQGLYGKNSFRGVSPDLQGRHFTNTPHGWLLNGPIRKLVNFSRGNLLNGDFALTRGSYDVIFCRNLLIYLNDKNRERALSTLDRMLLPQGILFVGHAESAPVLDKFFTPIVSSQAFAYRKKGVWSARGSSLPASSRNNAGRRKQPRSLAPKNPTSLMLPIAQVVSDIGKEKYTLNGHGNSVAPKNETRDARFPHLNPLPQAGEEANESLREFHVNALEQAQQYADQGKLSDAAALCEKSLREQGASAQAYYLLGLVHDAGCEAENARAYFNKAVYLEPDHYEALVQLALLAERQGDANNAAQLRKRAQRAVLRRGKK